MSALGQTRLGRADGRSGHVGYPPTATDFSLQQNFVMGQKADTHAVPLDKKERPPCSGLSFFEWKID
jgi:hypothetical protein